MHVLRGLLGVGAILALLWILSRDRRSIDWRLVASALGVHFLLAVLCLETPWGSWVFRELAAAVQRLLEFSYEGSGFVFGSLGSKDAPEAFLAFRALPIVIYFAALTSILYHFGVLQVAIYGVSRALGFFLRVSGAESMVAAANIFVGMTEAPLLVRPYIEGMTRSELAAVMTAGFATIAGTVMGIYMTFVGPAYAPYILAASVLAAPATFVTAKILVPETAEPATGAKARLSFERSSRNAIDAVALGVRDGLRLALNIAAMLVAFYALVALVNWPLGALLGTSLQELFGWALSPFAWLLGVDWSDSKTVGGLLGTKIALNEFVGYQSLKDVIAAGALGDRSARIATFALCGFANFGSIGITLGGLGGLAPSRRAELAELALPAMAAGALSSCLTAAVAGMFV
ncbi:MAG: NupC/NupG family nucleoside CNT transporter [Planctomycetota bacterium]